MPRIWLCILLLLLPVAVSAQGAAEDDRGFITRMIEDNLSAAGRDVRIRGFAGALSSRATFDELTVADAEGVWLTLRGGAVSWNRSALFSRRIEIDEMTAAEIEVARPPAAPAGTGPGFEASRFRLPDLPVAVQIGRIAAARVVLGPDVLGEPVTVTLDASVRLEAGEGSARLSIDRTDGAEGRLSLDGSYSNATRAVVLDLLAAEGADGIAARLLNVPGRPAMSLAVSGSGRPEDFAAAVALTTDGTPRLTGEIRLSEAAQDGAPPGRRFSARLSGDIAPVLLPQYRAFFGDDLSLAASGSRAGDGRLTLDRFDLAARALRVEGSAVLAPDGLPERADLAIRMGLPGAATLLPLPGAPVRLSGANLTFGFDAARGEAWTLAGTVVGLQRPGFSADVLRLDGSGRIGRAGRGAAADTVEGRLGVAARGLSMSDPGLAEAIGPDATGTARFIWTRGAPLRIGDIAIRGDGLLATGALSLRTGSGGQDGPGGPAVSGRIDAQADDLGRLARLAGRRLGGAASLGLDGTVWPLSGAFDGRITVAGRDLTVDIPEADRLLAGRSLVAVSARRDETGLRIREATVTAATLRAEGEGFLRTGAADLSARLAFGDLSVLGRGYRGRLSADATARRAGGRTRLVLDATGEDLGIGRAGLDGLLAGRAAVSFAGSLADGARIPLVERLAVETGQLTATADAGGTGGGPLRVEARLADLARFVPALPGPVTVSGRVEPRASDFGVTLDVSGPGRIAARVAGSIPADGASADLAIRGTAEAAMVNPLIAPRNISGPVAFDLSLRGPARLSSLAGTVRLDGARLVAPLQGVAVGGIAAAARLSGGRAAVTARGDVQGGGTVAVSGNLGLAAPFPADLSVRLAAARLRNPDLFDTRVTGALGVSGALAGALSISGDVALGETEIRIASTGPDYSGLAGDIRHVNEPAAVAATRARAGIAAGSERGPQGARRPAGLDISISAPSRVFVRGRGLDAEFGGSLRVGGTTAAVVPSGGFTLIRGRLDLLGKRFTIDEGQLLLQGAVVPTVRFAATTVTEDVTATIVLDGPASAPAVSFVSTPPLPEEEVVARLLFGRGLGSLSVFQAAQLASAVATLAGKGGEGLVGRLRSEFGLDDLDISGGADGTVAVKAGKYLSENLYSDVTLGADGKSAISLNLDVPPGVTLKSSVASDGRSSVGVFLERDY
ncbi:MAG: translocation/assembly module TamB domain-containing protein [Pseudomonadota bacterium]